MKVNEILTELRLDIPDQMVTVQVPLSTISDQEEGSDDGEQIRNPGRRVDSMGRFKWSPPLQQQLDAAKDAVGPSDQSVEVQDDEDTPEGQEHSTHHRDPQPDPEPQPAVVRSRQGVPVLTRASGPMG